MNKREKLPMQLEIISNILNNEKVAEILEDVTNNMTLPQMNAKVVRVLSETVKNNRDDMDELVALHADMKKEDVDKLTDRKYANILREAIMTDVLGFFG